MIPFASQRGSGQDLATHLLNEHDNEYMELADLRGAMADDLHGAFAEWEAQAMAMTKCQNYLYSLSINPDHRQGHMPRTLYGDYIDRVEDALGLTGQPRAVVMHIKDGREHAHVIWSRIDIQEMKAIHMAFDHDKLMGVTRQFAREHDIELAPGYHRLAERKRQTYRQLSLYERAQAEETGRGREEHQRIVTDLWQRRDTPAAFLQALEYHGYILAHGKRPFVLVDINGHTNSLPKLVDDKAVTQKTIAAFLGDTGAKENLPSIDDAKALAAQHRQALKDRRIAEDHADKRDALKARQEVRRAKLDLETAELKTRQEVARTAQAAEHADNLQRRLDRYAARVKLIQDQREAAKPTGLAGFLVRVSGVAFLRGKIHAHQDHKRETAHQEELRQLTARQSEERLELQRRQAMQSFDMERKRRALAQTEAREQQSLEKSFVREAQIRQRGQHQPGPAPGLHLKPPGRRAVPHKAQHRHTNPLAREMALAKQRADHAPPRTPDGRKLQEDFAEAARGDPAAIKSQEGRDGAGSADRTLKEPRERDRPKRVFKRENREVNRGPDRGRER